MIETREQRGFLAEVPRKRNRLHVGFLGGQVARDRIGIVAAAVIDIDDLDRQSALTAETLRKQHELLVKRRQPRGLVEDRDYDGEAFRPFHALLRVHLVHPAS